jgi:hypothetical protein
MKVFHRLLVLPVITLIAAGCAENATAPARLAAPTTQPSLTVVGAAGFVLMKKVGPLSSYTFDLSISQGTFSNGDPVTVAANEWTLIWEATNPVAPNANLEVQETLPANSQVDSVWITPLARLADGTLGELDNFKQVIIGTNQFEVPNVGWNRAAYVTVWNSEGRGGEGCTPGYWKQPHHYDSWTNYAPTQLFGAVFANAFPGMTLGKVVGQGGGGIKALGRHTVAALLNSASPNVDYPLTTAQVISKFNAAYASGSYEATKNEFAGLNERNCYLN